MSKNIALIGYMGSGKTTISQLLQEQYDYKKFSFAKEVKDIFQLIYKTPINKAIHRTVLQDIGRVLKKSMKQLDDYDYQCLHSWISQSQDFLKYFLSEINNDFEDIFTSDFYIQKTFNLPEFSMPYYKHNKATVDDMRFSNEADMWRSYNTNSVVILLDCPKEVVIERLKLRDSTFDEKWLDDISETSFQSIKPNYIIDATMPITDIMQEIESFGIL